tara:strand:+ start:2220 stop:3191 length:972 start_codon:yes stop_codon:yes gene_type:complete
MNKNKYILGFDGGGSKTKVIIFNQDGMPLVESKVPGTNLYVYKEKSVKLIINTIIELSKKINIHYSEISAFGFGLAGVSDLSTRDLLLRELDRMKIGDRSLILSDTEAAYQLLCPKGHGVLISIGTGIICMGRNEKGQTIKVAGKGYDNGDIGSGYWIGKKAINYILLNQSVLLVDKEIHSIFKIIKNKLDIVDIKSLDECFENCGDLVYKTASLAKEMINLAQDGNDVALAIIQEATRNVADYIVYLIDEIKYDKRNLAISGHGSIIKNDFYRRLLNDALRFDFQNLHWIFSDIPISVMSGILSAKCIGINVSINDVVKYRN